MKFSEQSNFIILLVHSYIFLLLQHESVLGEIKNCYRLLTTGTAWLSFLLHDKNAVLSYIFSSFFYSVLPVYIWMCSAAGKGESRYNESMDGFYIIFFGKGKDVSSRFLAENRGFQLMPACLPSS